MSVVPREVKAKATRTVLLVDDDVNTLVALETLMSEAGYSVLTATNGKDALEKAQNLQPDVVVSDMRMPVMDGRALVGALAADRRLSTVPVVLNSSAAAPPDVSVSAFLRKPYAPAQLLQLIRRLIREHRSRV
jgi:CheY-like chemotaxis protein